VSCAKTAEPIEMPFGIWIQVGPRIYVLDGGADRPMRRRNFLAETCPGMPDDTLRWAVQKLMTDWLCCGFTSHSTQNRLFRRRFPSQSLGLVCKT